MPLQVKGRFRTGRENKQVWRDLAGHIQDPQVAHHSHHQRHKSGQECPVGPQQIAMLVANHLPAELLGTLSILPSGLDASRGQSKKGNSVYL